jgi:hypothetical protein
MKRAAADEAESGQPFFPAEISLPSNQLALLL